MNRRKNDAVINRGDDGGDEVQVDEELLNKLMTPQKPME